MKTSSYEGGLRVPALIEWPQGIPEPRHTNVPCSTSDIYPTLLELTGANKPDDHPLDGISLMPLLEGKVDARPEPIGFWRHPIDGRSTWNHKILGSILELYNLKQDPNEENNVAEQNKDRLEAMLAELKEWQTSVVRSMNGADYR